MNDLRDFLKDNPLFYTILDYREKKGSNVSNKIIKCFIIQDNEIRDVSYYIASISKAKYNSKKGYILTQDIEGVFYLLGVKLFESSGSIKFKEV